MPLDTFENDMGGAFNASYNYDQFLGRSLRQGIIPLWDPNLGFGMPHLGNGLSAVLYPPNWLHALVPPRFADFILFLNWWLAAAFLVLFLLRIGLDSISSAIGALVVLCAGWFSGWLGLREITGVAAWFPFLLYAIERTATQPEWRWRYAAISVGVFCTIGAGHPEAFIASLLALCAYGIFATSQSPRPARTFADLCVGSVLGLALAAPVWLTFLETYQHSYQPHQTWSFFAGELSVNAHGFGNFIFPALFGGIHQHSFLGLAGSEYASVGWLPPSVLFFVLAGLLGARSRYTWFFLGLFLFVALKIYGFTPLRLLAKLPILKEIIWPRYAAFLMTLSAAILAAIGLAAIQRAAVSLRRVLVVHSFIVGSLAIELLCQIFAAHVPTYREALAALSLAVTWAILPPLLLVKFHDRYGAGWHFMIVAALGTALPAVAYNTGGFSWTSQLHISAYYALIFALLAAAIFPQRQFGGWTSIVVAILAIALPMVIFAKITDYGPPRRYDALTKPPYIEKLAELQKHGLYRHFPLDAAPMPNVQSGLGLPGLAWIVPTVPTDFRVFYQRFFDRGLQIPNWYAANVTPGTTPPALSGDELNRNIGFFSLAGVKYITAQHELVATGMAGLRKVFDDRSTGTSIFENPDASPRLFLATDIQVVGDQVQAWDLLARLGNPSGPIAVERSLPRHTACVDRALAIEQFSVDPNSVETVVTARCPGMLVLSDLYFPGWHVSLDGAEQEIYRVDGIFRGVYLERAGLHRVEFWYRPLSWKISLALLWLAVSVLIFIPLTRLAGLTIGTTNIAR